MAALICILGLASASPDFLVLTPEAFAPALAPLRGARSERLWTRIETIEGILAREEGADSPERIKRRLYRAWTRGTRYVLLVGDASRFPVRFMTLDRVHEPALHTAFYPSDLYYADVARGDASFDDWNLRRDDHHARYFGEVHGERNKEGAINQDGISHRPELAVGRWPVRSGAEVAAMVEKSLRARSRESRARRIGTALFLHHGGWVDVRPWQRRMGLLLEEHADVVHLHHDGPTPPTTRSILAHLEAPRGILVHCGHGEAWGFDGSLAKKDITRLPATASGWVAFSVGCSTAVFTVQPPYDPYLDADGSDHAGTNSGEVFSAAPPPPSPWQPERLARDSFGAQSVRHPSGFAAYIGCTTGSQPCAVSLAEGFVESLAEGAPTVGDAWRTALGAYWDKQGLGDLRPTGSWYPPSIFFQGMKFVLLGDPTLSLD